MFMMINEEKGYGTELIKYNGVYSLITSRLKDDGKVYKTWCNINYFADGKKKFIDKSMPLGVRLGDREVAISVLEQALRDIEEDVEDEGDRI